MQFAGYKLMISQGQEDSQGYVALAHGTCYTVMLSNNHSTRCDVTLRIDGKEVGTWRLETYRSIAIERPVNDTGRFTFYQLGTEEARQAGLEAHGDLGLVTATFTPEKWLQPTHISPYANQSVEDWASRPTRSAGHTAAGGTGLSGQSAQRFTTVDPLDYDYENQATLHIRLVAHESGPRPLQGIGRLSTPVPPPLP